MEFILGIVMCFAIAKIASADDQSGILWGVLAFVILLACYMVIPWPFARVLIAGGAAFVAMIAWKAIADR
jgi:hypothetical protein